MAHLGDSIFVVGIDFGTTYSGYAFASKQDFASDPPKFITSSWQGSKFMSLKAPTAVLLNPDQTLKSFGYDAENIYSELVSDGDHESHFYFHEFKTLLHNEMIMVKRVTRTTEIKDMTGKPMQAIKVFSLAIGYLKDRVVESIKVVRILQDDFYFVLTVPATWNETAKQFMRDAAEMAGIKKEKIAIALEPEAASIFCQNLLTDRTKDLIDFSETVKSGMKYMVIDLGGETADITVYQRQIIGTVKEVLPRSGGPWGGKSIDKAFSNFLTHICGPTVMEHVKNSEPEDYIDLFREFEAKKRSIKTDQTSKVVITLPVALTELVETQHGTFEIAVENSRYRLSVSYAKQKLLILPDAFRDLFKFTIDNLIKHLGKILSDRKLYDLNTILMVGGFSECELLQDAVRQNIGKKIKLIIPEEAGLAVLKGAVLFGFQKNVVSERFTY